MWSLFLLLTSAFAARRFPLYTDNSCHPDKPISLFDYDALSNDDLRANIVSIAKHIRGHFEQVMAYYSKDPKQAMHDDPAVPRGKIDFETVFDATRFMYAMDILIDGTNFSQTPIIDLLFWQLKHLVNSTPEVSVVKGGEKTKAFRGLVSNLELVSWKNEYGIDFYSKEPNEADFRALVFKGYIRAVNALKMGIPSHLQMSKQNAHLYLSFSRLLYLCAKWKGTFVPTQRNYSVILGTISISVKWQTPGLTAKFNYPRAFPGSWAEYFENTRLIPSSLMALLQSFEPIKIPLLIANLVLSLYDESNRDGWRSVVGPYRSQQIDEYFATARQELGLTSTVDEETLHCALEVIQVVGDMEAEEKAMKMGESLVAAEKGRKKDVAKPSFKISHQEVLSQLFEDEEEEVGEETTNAVAELSKVQLSQIPLPVSINFAAHLIVAQYFNSKYGVKADKAMKIFIDARDKMVHPNIVQDIVIDGEISEQVLNVVAEISRLTGRPIVRVPQPFTYQSLYGISQKWASHAHVVVQVSHLCDTFNFSILSQADTQLLSGYCMRIKQNRNKYAHPDWRKFNLRALLERFGF